MQTYGTSKFRLQSPHKLVEQHGFIVRIQAPQKGLELGGVLPNRSRPLRDSHQLALRLLRAYVGTKTLQEGRAQLGPISGHLSLPSFVCCIPLMRGIAQEGNSEGDLLCVITPHKREVMTDERCPHVDILVASPIKAGRLFRPPLRRGKGLGRDYCPRT